MDKEAWARNMTQRDGICHGLIGVLKSAGLVYVRLQAWFPFNVHVGMNGREWLARQTDQSGLRYQRLTHTSRFR